MDLDALIKQLCDDTTKEMSNILTSAGKGNSNIINMLDFDIQKESDDYLIQTNFPDYAIFVDRGRKSGKMPPVKNIMEWCVRKNIPKNAAFPIARSIGQNGIPPTNFMSPIKDMVSELKKILAKYYVNKVVGGISVLKK